jgi:predicted enzyme related to lactoylglutathione lyase
MNPLRNPVGWFEIYVQDMDRAKAFYQNVFEVNLEKLESPVPDIEMWAFPPLMASERPGCAGSLCKMKGKDSGGGGTIVYFSCEDCAVEASRVVPSGGRILFDKTSIGDYGFIAMFTDPDGNTIGLHSME